MGKVEYYAMIKFLTRVGKKVKEMQDMLVVMYNDTAPSYATVTCWHKKFCHGCEFLEDVPRVGHPSKAISEDTVDHVEAMITEN